MTGCQIVDVKNIRTQSLTFLKFAKESKRPESELAPNFDERTVSNNVANGIISKLSTTVDVDSGFENAIRAAVKADPIIIAATEELNSGRASVDIIEGRKDFQLSWAIYGGIVDVSDETAGLAVVLRANRVLFDAGKIENQIVAERYKVASLEHSLKAQINMRALYFARLWVDLERYTELNSRIESRIDVLDPLISQLEKVAESGLGDVTQVAAAQRTVSKIRVR